MFGILKEYGPILYLYEFVFKFIETSLGIFEAKQRISLDVGIYFVAIDGDIRSTYECSRPINRLIYANIHIISCTNADFKPNKTAYLHNGLNHSNNRDSMCWVLDCIVQLDTIQPDLYAYRRCLDRRARRIASVSYAPYGDSVW